VRGAGTRRGDRHADPSACARISVGHMRGALLMANEHVMDRVLRHRVVRGQNRAAWISEHRRDAVLNEGLPEDSRTRDLHMHSTYHIRIFITFIYMPRIGWAERSTLVRALLRRRV